MDFGITFKGFISPQRARNLAKQAEEAGFTHCYFYDSHILWRECYPAIAMCMEHTSKISFGPCVTNPNARDWSLAASLFASLALQSNGRFHLGLGRGDSSVRVMGKKPANLARVAEFTQKVKAMVRGEKVMYGECPEPVQFPWAEGFELPVYIGAYGPKALKTAGEVGDGVVLQIAEPSLIKWFAEQAISAGEAEGRDMSNYQVIASAPAYVGNKALGIEATRWFPAMVGNHVADIVEKYGATSGAVPDSLTAYIENRKGYDYSKHGQSDNPYLEFITPEVVESFCVLGDIEDHIEKMKELEASGTTQFNIYLDNGDEESIVEQYGKHIIPKFSKK
ncbi:TIGR03842 family LLM class F420-dependent oxidoreductase [Vibrio sp. S9_S30]|uniref:TIGR03842 family LLM class F420-dependent oxidoreductase n=1 Tax=Vibrio sp. S9_S30 TaxID=2720226 RepID=UPI00168123F4|nr:TIGR03842 family LLM class F420-dependent oxidoreductase [Vibrio sp. S9_S30]MBD1558578.1 TIGR03842 family LLM class F420-dependent oxidoreductase [Vibrio sp. S9_S30]